MRFALAGLILALSAAALVTLAGAGPDGEQALTAPPVPPRSEVLERTPPAILGTCRSAASAAPMPPHCPLAIPPADGAWGRARALDSNACEYLIDLGPGTSRDKSRGPIYHLLFGGRCRRFDLTADHRRWPKDGFFANDLRLV